MYINFALLILFVMFVEVNFYSLQVLCHLLFYPFFESFWVIHIVFVSVIFFIIIMAHFSAYSVGSLEREGGGGLFVGVCVCKNAIFVRKEKSFSLRNHFPIFASLLHLKSLYSLNGQ